MLLLRGFVAMKIRFFFFWLHWALVSAHGLSLVAASGGYPLVAMLRFLTALASLAAEHRL